MTFLSASGWRGRWPPWPRAVGDLDAATLAGVDADRLLEEFTKAERVAQAGKALCAARAAKCGAWRAAGERSRPGGWPGARAAPASARRRPPCDRPAMAEGPSTRSAKPGRMAGCRPKPPARSPPPPRADRRRRRPSGRRRAGRHDGRVARRLSDCPPRCALTPPTSSGRYQAVHRARSLRTWVDGDGAGRFDARLTPDALARFRCLSRPLRTTSRRHRTPARPSRRACRRCLGRHGRSSQRHRHRRRMPACAGAGHRASRLHRAGPRSHHRR